MSITKDNILNLYYKNEIQLTKEVINDILDQIINKNKKVLVFGLGYDSLMWYKANGEKNIWFVESKDEFIKLNKNIDSKYIIKYEYKHVSVKRSFVMKDSLIKSLEIPKQLLENGPYDLILIDGPWGGKPIAPGRLLPVYWSTCLLSKPETFIYLDDTNRELETYLINKYLKDYKVIKKYNERLGSICFAKN
jgi:hypothetical protein